MPPRVKHEDQFVTVPANLSRHPIWLSSKTLADICRTYNNQIPSFMFKHIFDKVDQVTTRLEEVEGFSSASAVAAITLCFDITDAHFKNTREYLTRKRSFKDPWAVGKTVSSTGPSPSSDSAMAAELRNELSRVQRVLVQHLVGIQNSAVNIETTQTSLKRRIDAIEKNDNPSDAMEAMVRKAESRVGILEQRGQIVSAGMSDALKRVGELETRLDFQESLLMSCKDAVNKVNVLQARQTQQEENVNQCLLDIKNVGSRLDGLEVMMKDIKAMLENGSPSGTPAPEMSVDKSGQLPTPPKEKAPEEVAQPATDATLDTAGTETPSAKRQRKEAVAESIAAGMEA